MKDLLIYASLAIVVIGAVAGVVAAAIRWLDPDRHDLKALPAPTVTELAQQMRAADLLAWEDRVGMPPPATDRMYLRHAHIAHGHITGRQIRSGQHG